VESAHHDRGSAGALAAAVAEVDDANICTIQKIKVQYRHQHGGFFVSRKTMFTAGSSKLTILDLWWHAQAKPPCHYVVKTVRTRYHHREFYPAGSTLQLF
jgi:hypothetical protein